LLLVKKKEILRLFPELILVLLIVFQEILGCLMMLSLLHFKYGVEHEFDSGLKFTGGVGFGIYRGENDDVGIGGSKKITLNSFGAKSKLEFGDSGVFLDYTNKFFNPEQFHLFSFLPIPLEQDTRVQEHFTDLGMKTPYFDFQTNWINGGKSDEYSMLIAKNDMSFSGGEIGIFPKFAFWWWTD